MVNPMVSQWELNVALGMLGLTDEQKQTVIAALPVAARLVDHIAANKQLFATLYADGQMLLPAAKIVLDALAANGYTARSFVETLQEKSR